MTGTVVHLDAHVVVVPTEPAAPTGLPRSEQLRRELLAANPGWTPDDRAAADAARRACIAERLRSDSWAVVELHGADLPADSVRAQVRGELTGRSVHVDSWRPEPCSTSSWAPPRVEGADTATADAIVRTVPDDTPLLSVGVSATTAGRSAVMLEVDHLTPEILSWFERQPPGSVQLDIFVDLVPSSTA